MNTFRLVRSVAVLAGLVSAMIGTKGSIPDSPDEVCANEEDLDYESGDYYWYDDDSLVLVLNEIAVNGSNQSVWVIYNYAYSASIAAAMKNTSAIQTYCSSMPTDYTPNSTYPGDPRDCDAWTDGGSVETASDCLNVDTSLSWIDYIFVVYAGIVLAVIGFAACKGKCNAAQYDAANEEVYREILKKQGVDPDSDMSGKRSAGGSAAEDEAARGKTRSATHEDLETRPLYIQLLKHDLNSEKIVWHGDIWTDYFFFLRSTHTVFALAWSHPLHTFSRNERRTAFAATLGLVVTISCVITFVTVVALDTGNEVTWVIGFVTDFVLGFAVVLADALLESLGVCACADEVSIPCCRRCLKCCGNCGMVAWLGVAIVLALGSMFFVFVGLELSYPDLDSLDIFQVWLINLFTGLVFGWFLLDIVGMTVYFALEWRRQVGRADEAFRGRRCVVCVDDECTNCCWLSWICLVCAPCYYCRRKRNSKRDYDKYPKWRAPGQGDQAEPDSGNGAKAAPELVVGNMEGVRFAVIWKDYQAYKKPGFEASGSAPDDPCGVTVRRADIEEIIEKHLPKTAGMDGIKLRKPPSAPAEQELTEIIAS